MSNTDPLIPTASEIGKEAGLLVFGAAAGLLAAGLMSDRVRKPLGLALGAAGLAAAGPEISKLINKAVNSPANSFGSKRTLEGIRNSAGAPIQSADPLGEEDGTPEYIIG